MRTEPAIPLFLWVATAIVAHALMGGGATEVVQRIEETLDIKSFAREVRRHAKTAGAPVEISILAEDEPAEEEEATEAADVADDELPEIDPSEEEADSPDDEVDESDPDEADEVDEAPVTLPEEVKEEEKPKEKPEEKPEETKPEPEVAEKKEEVPDLQLAPVKPPPPPDRRVAVDQHVEDKEQEDNPDAQFQGEHANHVDEETRARVSATDGDTAPPTMGGPNGGAGDEPGNSEVTKVAESEESEGRRDHVPGDAGAHIEKAPAAPAQAAAALPAVPPTAGRPQAPAQSTPPRPGQKAQEARAATQAQEEVVETIASANGTYAVPKAQEASAAQKARQARKARAGSKKSSPTKMLGLGSKGTTANGVNLNLNFKTAQAIIGKDHLARLKQDDGKRRLSQHRGKWQNMGIEKWKPALENYVATVKPGTQTALNTAQSPFARYLNYIHQRLHHVFADDFLGFLNRLPATDPLNNQNMSTHIEIALSREDGRIVKIGVTKSSGVTAFDVGALESVSKAAPYGVPPSSIVSPDGNVYLHWEFHRKPMYACSTYFARPFILNNGQKSAPTRVTPPPRPTEDKKKKKREERSGAIERKAPSASKDSRG